MHCLQSIAYACLILLAWCSYSTIGFSQDDRAVSFRRDVKPILQQHCLTCHGGVKKAGDLKLSDEQAVRGIIDSNNPAASVFLERIQSTDDQLRMPPPEHGPSLTAEQIQTIATWIAAGAQWERHWSFDVPTKTALPSTAEDTWCRNSIDTWIANGWTQIPSLGLHEPKTHSGFKQTVAPKQWLRRVTLALTGQLPTADEYAWWESKCSNADPVALPFAMEEKVDELLASPKFGEHWATMWLDQMRYADSRGLGQDGPRTMWKYRDWVVDAFNNDLPFDDFTRMQLGGDLKPNRSIEDSIATAAHRLTQTNEEGGTDDEEFRTLAVIDRINTTWQVWQGITFGCVQCHDHPYDPIQQRDFYAFMAYWNNSSDWDLNEEFPLIRVPVDPSDYNKASQLDQRIDELNQVIFRKEREVFDAPATWTNAKLTNVTATRNTQVVIEPERANEFHTVGTVARDTEYAIQFRVEKPTSLKAIQITIRPLDPDKARLYPEVGAVLSQIELAFRTDATEAWRSIELSRVVSDEPEPFLNPNGSLDPKDSNGFGAYARIQSDRRGVLLLKSAVELPADAEIQLTIAHKLFVLDAYPLVSRRIAIDYSDSNAIYEQMLAPEFVNLGNRLAELRVQRQAIAFVTLPVMRQITPELQRVTNIFDRGLFLTKGDEVAPGLPPFIVNDKKHVPTNRLEVAHWLVSNDNPLTARVHVNRVWARLFGRGLVATEEDFGSSGDVPTHRELLDELAYDFQHVDGWSQKRLIRKMVLSATFTMSNASDTSEQEVDPENRWLMRGPRVRLPAEVIRDAALSVADLIDSRIGGPPTHPPIPNGVWKPFQGGDAWKTAEVGSKERYRRSIYTYTKRSIPYPMFATFDAPTREFCTSRRANSNTPTQALMMLNDDTMIECAESIASRLVLDAAWNNDDARTSCIAAADRLWTRILGRELTIRERTRLVEYIDQSLANRSAEQVVASLALMILNHDEAYYQ